MGENIEARVNEKAGDFDHFFLFLYIFFTLSGRQNIFLNDGTECAIVARATLKDF